MTYIYVIGREEGPVKVGITKSLGSRLTTIQTGCPFPIKIHHYHLCANRDEALWEERNFHEIYAEKRLAGEWFDIDADLAAECIETSFEIKEYLEKEALRERQIAALNIWDDHGPHSYH